MEDLNTNTKLNIESSLNETLNEDVSENIISEASSNNTDLIEYKEVDEPCVALTIIGENKLTDAEVFIRHGIRYSIKAFFSAIVLTIMNLFI